MQAEAEAAWESALLTLDTMRDVWFADQPDAWTELALRVYGEAIKYYDASGELDKMLDVIDHMQDAGMSVQDIPRPRRMHMAGGGADGADGGDFERYA